MSKSKLIETKSLIDQCPIKLWEKSKKQHNDYEYIYDPSATTYSGKHEFELIFTENELKNLNSFVLTNNNSTYKTNNKRSYKKKINKISTKKNESIVDYHQYRQGTHC